MKTRILLCSMLMLGQTMASDTVEAFDEFSKQINQKIKAGQLSGQDAYRDLVEKLSSFSSEQIKELLDDKNTREAIQDSLSGVAILLMDGVWGGYGQNESAQDVAAEIEDKKLPEDWRLLRLTSFVPEFSTENMINSRLLLPDADGIKAWLESVDSFQASPSYDDALLNGYAQLRYVVALFSSEYPSLGKEVQNRDLAQIQAQPDSAPKELGIQLINALNSWEEKIRSHKGYPPFEANRQSITQWFSSSDFGFPEGLNTHNLKIRNSVENPKVAARPKKPNTTPEPMISKNDNGVGSKNSDSSVKPSLDFLRLGLAGATIVVVLGAILWLRYSRD